MRAARLLHLLLILQNRGRQTSRQLADQLEVSTRTILRDVDAMTEAGLPIIVHQGNQGGIELGFNYRTRLTGLAQEEAEALGLILAASNPMLAALGLDTAARHARAKLIESLPDTSRAIVQRTLQRFHATWPDKQDDPRIEAMAKAVRNSLRIRLRFSTPNEQLVYPTAIRFDGSGWDIHDSIGEIWVPISQWGRINVSAQAFG